MSVSTYDYDVAIIGYGPTSVLTANYLGKFGISTLIIERDKDLYSRARAVTVDRSTIRIFQGVERYTDVIDIRFGHHYDSFTQDAFYSHHVRMADRWRVGRVLLAGDAAHLMPPWADQGMQSGFRDGFALAWKLRYILQHGVSDEFLDTYQQERQPHTLMMTTTSVQLGKLIEAEKGMAQSIRNRMLPLIQAPHHRPEDAAGHGAEDLPRGWPLQREADPQDRGGQDDHPAEGRHPGWPPRAAGGHAAHQEGGRLVAHPSDRRQDGGMTGTSLNDLDTPFLAVDPDVLHRWVVAARGTNT